MAASASACVRASSNRRTRARLKTECREEDGPRKKNAHHTHGTAGQSSVGPTTTAAAAAMTMRCSAHACSIYVARFYRVAATHKQRRNKRGRQHARSSMHSFREWMVCGGGGGRGGAVRCGACLRAFAYENLTWLLRTRLWMVGDGHACHARAHATVHIFSGGVSAQFFCVCVGLFLVASCESACKNVVCGTAMTQKCICIQFACDRVIMHTHKLTLKWQVINPRRRRRRRIQSKCIQSKTVRCNIRLARIYVTHVHVRRWR